MTQTPYEDADEQFERREVHHIPMALFEAAIGSENTTIYDEFESMENPVYK